MRRALAIVTAVVLLAASAAGVAASASASVVVPSRNTCNYYTFMQYSAADNATLRTIVGVCTGQPVCERRDLIVPNHIYNLYNTCPASPRR